MESTNSTGSLNILFIVEVDWLKKVVFDIHSLAELLSLRGHNVFAIDYPDIWTKDNVWDLGSLRTTVTSGICRAVPGASVHLRRPGYLKIPGLSRLSAEITHYFEIKKTIIEKKIDIIVLYSVPTNGLQAIHSAKKYHIPVVFRSIDILNQLVRYPILRPATRFLERKVYSASDMVLTITPGLSQYVVKNGAAEAKVKLLPMPVDTDLFHPGINTTELRQKWGLGEHDEIVLFMGTLFDFSGLDVFLPEFPGVIEQIPHVKLLIVGDGPQRPRLEKIITDLNLRQHVIITGFQPYQTMPQYINMATICINTFIITDATRDIFPGKTVQFLACGKAFLATSLPGMRAVIPGEQQGVLYVRDAGEMVQSIIFVLQSPDLRQQLECNGLSYVINTHSYAKIADSLESRLREAIRGKNRE